MSDDLRTRLHTAITTQRDEARKLLTYAQQNSLTLADPKLLGMYIPGWHEWPDVERMAMLALAQCERDQRVLDRHPPHRLADLWTVLVPPDPDPPRCWCCHMIHPCPEITDLATVYLETPCLSDLD